MNAYLQFGLGALADPTRFAILESLMARPQAVNELATRFPVSRPAVSQHLKVLKDAGLVWDRKAGTRRVYAANAQGIARLREHFNAMWDQALLAFKAAAEEEEL